MSEESTTNFQSHQRTNNGKAALNKFLAGDQPSYLNSEMNVLRLI